MICQNWFHCESAASFGEISQIYGFTKALYWHILPHVVLDTAYTAGCSGLVVSVSDCGPYGAIYESVYYYYYYY